jgi:hypothetical protein
VPRAGEAGYPVADSDVQVGTTDAPVLEWERRGWRSLMDGKWWVATRLHVLRGVRGGRWSGTQRGSTVGVSLPLNNLQAYRCKL